MHPLYSVKFQGKKRGADMSAPSCQRQPAWGVLACIFVFLPGGGVGDDLLELGDVLQESLAPRFAQPAERLRTIVFRPFPHLDEPRLLEELNLPGEISIGERAQRLQVVEDQPLRM